MLKTKKIFVGFLLALLVFNLGLGGADTLAAEKDKMVYAKITEKSGYWSDWKYHGSIKMNGSVAGDCEYSSDKSGMICPGDNVHHFFSRTWIDTSDYVFKWVKDTTDGTGKTEGEGYWLYTLHGKATIDSCTEWSKDRTVALCDNEPINESVIIREWIRTDIPTNK